MTLEEYEMGFITKDFRKTRDTLYRNGYTTIPKMVLSEMLKGRSFIKKELEDYKYASVSRLIYEIKLLGYEVVKEKKTAFNKAYTKYRLHSKHLSNGSTKGESI
jgi:hypothetical protein